WKSTFLPSALFNHACSSCRLLQRAASWAGGTASGFAALAATLGRLLALALALAAGTGAEAARGGGASIVFSVRQPGIGLSLYWILPRASTHLYICAWAGSNNASSKAVMSTLMDSSSVRA